MRTLLRAPTLLACMIAFMATRALADDHLQPEWTPYLGYDIDGFDELLVAAFKEAYGDDVRARLIVVPSFQPEYALGIREVNGGYRIFVLKPSTRLWYFPYREMLRRGQIETLGENGPRADEEEQRRLDATLPERPEDVPLNRCEVDMARPTAERLIEVWRAMLVRTRFDNVEPGGPIVITGDGTTYHFSMTVTDTAEGGGRNIYGRLAGKTWSPYEASEPGKLVAITDTMRDLCFTKRLTLARRLDAQVAALAATLSAGTRE